MESNSEGERKCVSFVYSIDMNILDRKAVLLFKVKGHIFTPHLYECDIATPGKEDDDNNKVRKNSGYDLSSLFGRQSYSEGIKNNRKELLIVCYNQLVSMRNPYSQSYNNYIRTFDVKSGEENECIKVSKRIYCSMMIQKL